MNGDLQFVDTNVLIYAHDLSAGTKRDTAATLLTNLWESRRGCLSVQVLQEFYVAATSKVQMPLPRDKALQIVMEYGNWTVQSPGPPDVVRAIGIHARYGISFWDAMIVVSACKLGCGTLWSEDLNPGQAYEGITVKNPFTQG